MQVKKYSFLKMVKSLVLLPFFFVAGCMGEGSGILVYDLAEGRVASFIPQNNQERKVLLIQRGANGETFFTFDEHGKYLSKYSWRKDGKSYIAERGINGDIVAKWETAIPPPYEPMVTMALSPDREKMAFLDINKDIKEIQITTKDGVLLKKLTEGVEVFGGLTKGIYWLSDETVITYSSQREGRAYHQIIRYDLKTDEVKTIDYSFALLCLTTHRMLPSPDNRYVLLLRESDNDVDILDPWAMTLVGEVQVVPGLRKGESTSTNFAWLNNNEFLVWDEYSNRIIRYNISTRQSTLVKVEFPAKKYRITAFVGDHFILSSRNKRDFSKWSYNVKTKELRRITKYAVGCIYPLNDNIILLDYATRP